MTPRPTGYYWIVDSAENYGVEMAEWDDVYKQWWRCGAGAYDDCPQNENVRVVAGPLDPPTGTR